MEEVIYQDKRVKEVAIIGVAHPRWVEAVAAIIVPKEEENITEEEILDLCKKELAPFKVPKKVVFVDELPKTPTGKLLKRKMRETYRGLFSR
ncbi:MAG: hypothetical protein V2A69_01595 [Pseudomonadota bacterium]